MIRYDEHAVFQMERRAILQEDVEETIRNPDETETGPTRLSYLKCLPGRRTMLRVVVSVLDPEYVITAFYDRKKPCE